jgi:hypothetical protein
MTSKVRVNMRLCDKVSTILATTQEDGTFKMEVQTTCDNVREFSRGLESLTITDLTDKADGRVFDRMRQCKMSANCLVPAGLISAGWVEAGMIAKSNAKKNKCNEVEFVFD